MNSLGISYAVSSDDEDGDTERPIHAPAPPAVMPSRVAARQPTAIEIEGFAAEPPGAADPQVQARIARFLELQQQSDTDSRAGSVKSFQENLQTKKEVANPSILDKVVEYFGIDELHTNFARELFDPYGLPLHEYTESISLEQKKRQEEKLQQQQQRSHITFTHGS